MNLRTFHPRFGVWGCGDTTEEAIAGWNEDFKRRVKGEEPDQDNEVTQYIRDTLSSSKNKVW